MKRKKGVQQKQKNSRKCLKLLKRKIEVEASSFNSTEHLQSPQTTHQRKGNEDPTEWKEWLDAWERNNIKEVLIRSTFDMINASINVLIRKMYSEYDFKYCGEWKIHLCKLEKITDEYFVKNSTLFSKFLNLIQ